LLGVVILTAIVSFVEYIFFKESLNRKNELIKTLKKQLDIAQGQASAQDPVKR